MPLSAHNIDVSRYDHIIWDWNGTLLDDVDLCIDVVGDLLTEHGLPTPSKERYRRVFGFPIENYYRRLGFDFDQTPFADLADQYIKVYDQRAGEAKLHEGVLDLITNLANRGIQHSILSASSQTHILDVTAHFGVDHLFEHIYGIGDHMAHSKRARGLDLIADAHYAPERTLMIGDTDHDHEVGTAMGVDVLLVAHGHQSYERLIKVHEQVAHGL